jgi:hypothetical protein
MYIMDSLELWATLLGFSSLMVAVIVVLLYYVYRVITKLGVFFLYFSFVMMAFMLVGASVYLYSPSETSLGVAVGVNMASMILLLAYFFAVAERLTEEFTMREVHYYSLAGLVVLNEGLMGLTFGLAQFGRTPFSDLALALYNSLNSYWFFYPMMAEMLSLYFILLSRRRAPLELFPLIGITAFPPTIFTGLLIWRYTALVMGLGMSALGLTFKSRLRLLYIVTILGVITTVYTPWLFDTSIIAGMVLYYVVSFKAERIARS